MSPIKKIILLLALTLSSALHANFTLGEVGSHSSIGSSVPKESATMSFSAPVAPPPSFEEENSEPQEFNYWQEFFRMMLILGMILGAVLIIAWILKGYLNKRIKQVNQQNRIKVLERRNLSQKSMLYLVEVEGKQLLIADSASGGVKFLMDCPEEKEAEASTEAMKTRDLASKFSFTQILQRKLTQKALTPFSNSKNLKTDYEVHEEN